MRICFLSSMHGFNDKRVAKKEAMSLIRAGYDVVHVCPGLESDINDDCSVKTVVYPPPWGIRGRIFQLVRLYKIAKYIDADVYHCNEVDSWFVGVCLQIFTGKLCVFDVHEHYPSTFAEKRFPGWMKPLVASCVRGMFRILLPFTKRLVLAKETVSEDFPMAPYKKVLVRNFATIHSLAITSSVSREDITVPPTLVHLGLFGKHRGWPQVLDAMARMRHDGCRLKVVGDINDGTRSEFEARVKELGLESRIELHDWLPFTEAFKHLAESHIGLIAFQPGILNHVYAMPHKMFDYMAAGTAVLCPAFAVEVAPIVKKSRCGLLIDPSSPKDMAAKIDSLLDDRGALLRMGQRGRRAVVERYNWEAEAERLIDMYREIETDVYNGEKV